MHNEPIVPTGRAGQSVSADLVAQGYDAVYAAMPLSPTLQRIWKEHAAGADYPDEFSHISFLTLAELRRMGSELQLSQGMKLADLACGTGGPGLWLARELQADLIGIDVSAVGVAGATQRAEAIGLPQTARFSTGSFEQTGLESGSVDAVMSVDALQYAPSKLRAFEEIARILRTLGRFVFTAFEFHPDRAAGRPVIGVDPVEDYRPLLEEAGLRVLAYEETPGWRERLTGAYDAAIAEQATLRDEMGPLAVAALLSEMTVTLERQIYRCRVFSVAELVSAS